MDSNWERFISRCQDALGDLVEGRPEPFQSLWSHADDVVIIGAFGGHERGWEQVSARLDWAAAGIKATNRLAENVVTVVGDDLAYTVDLEHMTRHTGDQPTPQNPALHPGLPARKRRLASFASGHSGHPRWSGRRPAHSVGLVPHGPPVRWLGGRARLSR